MQNEYDVIISLGGNCTVANNLRYRNMRHFSLPFDWVYMLDDTPLIYLQEGFCNKFEKLCLKKNLVKIQGNDSHKIIYQDTYSGFCFPNHFENENLTEEEYQLTYNKLRKRIDRFFECIKKNDSILFVLACELQFKKNDIIELKNTVLRLYPNKKIDFRVMMFNSEIDETEILDENICIYRYKRPQNLYDFTKTNYEWSFLDDIGLRCPTFSTNKFIRLLSIKLFRKKIKFIISWE